MKKYFYTQTLWTGRVVENCVVFAYNLEHARTKLAAIDAGIGTKSFNVREA